MCQHPKICFLAGQDAEAVARYCRPHKLPAKTAVLSKQKSKEAKKRELFQNLNKIRHAGEPFSKVIITHDLTKNKRRS